jgi:hypothetical protein
MSSSSKKCSKWRANAKRKIADKPSAPNALEFLIKNLSLLPKWLKSQLQHLKCWETCFKVQSFLSAFKKMTLPMLSILWNKFRPRLGWLSSNKEMRVICFSSFARDSTNAQRLLMDKRNIWRPITQEKPLVNYLWCITHQDKQP